MWWRLLQVGLLVAPMKAFKPAPIQWVARTGENFVVVPQDTVVPAKLTIVDHAGGVSHEAFPHFAAKLDNTITWNGNLCMEAGGRKPRDIVLINHCSGKQNQKWHFLPWSGGTRIQLHDSSLCIDVDQGNVLSGAPIELRQCASVMTESWKFEGFVVFETESPKNAVRFVVASMMIAIGALSFGVGVWGKHLRKHQNASALAKQWACMTAPLSSQRLLPAVMAVTPVHNSEASSSASTMTRCLSPCWQRLDFSIKQAKKQRGGSFVQISTVDPHGMPSCRTVVFRGFEICNSPKMAEQKAFKIVTDRRSEKFTHLQNNPFAELVWWMPSTNEQYRVFGEVKLLDRTSELTSATSIRNFTTVCLDTWQNLSDSTREQFFWDTPGVNISAFAQEFYSKDKKYDYVKDGTKEGDCPTMSDAPEITSHSSNGITLPQGGRDPESGKILDVPDNFIVLLLFPQQIKYLRLRENFAQVDKLEGGEWKSERVNP